VTFLLTVLSDFYVVVAGRFMDYVAAVHVEIAASIVPYVK
jgi:hypothetical protein